MADRSLEDKRGGNSHSQDLLESPCKGPAKSRSASRRTADKLKTKALKSSRNTSAEEKDAKQRLKALEKQIAKAEKKLSEQLASPISVPSTSCAIQTEQLGQPHEKAELFSPPEGAGERFPSPAQLVSRDTNLDPFSCFTTNRQSDNVGRPIPTAFVFLCPLQRGSA